MRRTDDLQLNGLKIIQETTAFCFGVDAVFLSDFAAECKNVSKICDLGTGNGILPLLLSQKLDYKKIVGIEIQKDAAELAMENVAFNKLENIEIVNADFREIILDSEFDLVVCNPPYKPIDKGLQSPENARAIARNEIYCNLEDVAKTAAKLLKYHGKFCIVHKPERLSEIFETCIKYDLEPKRLKMVQAELHKPPSLVLVEASYKGNKGLIIEAPLIIGG